MRMRRLWCALFTAAVAGSAARADTLGTFAVGNSLTEDASLLAMDHMAAQRGRTSTSGVHVNYGQTLDQIWKSPNTVTRDNSTANTSPPYTPFPTAFASATPWDAIVLEPFQSGITGNKNDLTDPGDRARIVDFMNYASGNTAGHTPPGVNTAVAGGNAGNLNAQYYVYARFSSVASWSQGTNNPNPASRGVGYHEAWSMPYGGDTNEPGWPAERGDFFGRLVESVRATQPAGTRPIELIPVGHVFDAIEVEIKSGGLTGLTMARLYRDSLHLSELGRFVAASTFYAVLSDDDPTGLLPPADFPGLQTNALGRLSSYPEFTPDTLAELQSIVWQTVVTTPYTGVPEPGAILALGAAPALLRRRRPART